MLGYCFGLINGTVLVSSIPQGPPPQHISAMGPPTHAVRPSESGYGVVGDTRFEFVRPQPERSAQMQPQISVADPRQALFASQRQAASQRGPPPPVQGERDVNLSDPAIQNMLSALLKEAK
eukprot:m.203830 g.203830  ORF g.203830 m.203830 type:complete len:121 (+) comp16879_c8_seq2:478-840(+)